MNAIEQIMSQLAEVFAPLDAKVHKETQVWAIERTAAIKAKKDELKSKRREMGEWAYYKVMFDIAGGKTWYNVFDGNSAEAIARFVTKNCEAVAAKRNAMIANKLTKAGVTGVITSTFARSNDGFNGIFTVQTPEGNKTVTVNTIYAGGYNIQCLHLRVLCKVK